MPSPPPTGPIPEDWPRLATDQVVKVVDTVRDKTTGPVLAASRYLVYGLILAAAASIIAVLGLIGTVRLLDILLPREVWLVYVLLGTAFCIGGAVCWSKRNTPSPS